MLVLFSIAMVCFFALFGMLVVLLRQARAEGAAERKRRVRSFGATRRHLREAISSERGRFAPIEPELDLSLSSLVPGKQPDFRFMVREGGRPSSQAIAETARKPVRSDRLRPDWAHYNADLGDLTDPQAAAYSNTAKRA